MMNALYLFSLLTALSAAAPQTVSQNCKPIPGTPGWPTDTEWNALNTSVSGRLVGVNPPGAVCHPSQPTYNNASCAIISQQWQNSSWHASNPWSTDYNDDTCLPDATYPCSTSGYPAYVIEATNVADVQAGVRFANTTGVRLVIKATGHDYPGRSKGPHSLEIWTHLLKGLEFTMGDPEAVRYEGAASVKMGVGMQWAEVYAESSKHNLTVIGGSDPDVGVAGWMLSGGHSPISALYGLGADQILEMEVVTADGEHRIINENAYPDLFWAVRGGGGSTFAIVVSVTVKAYPPLAGTLYQFSYNTTARSDTYWSLATYVLSQLPALSEAGVMGYLYIQNASLSPDPKQAGSVNGIWIFPKRTAEQAEALITPVENALNSSSWSKDPVYIHRTPPSEFTDFMAAWGASSKAESVGSDSRLGSWLLNGHALHSDPDTLKAQLQKASPERLIGQFVSGPGVRDAVIPGGSDAVLPAWRTAYLHLDLPVSWTPHNVAEKTAATNRLRDEIVPALKALAPESGAYMSESDPSNPDWQHDFYGANYPRLLQIKKQWDPRGVFWCKPCVGHELWDLIDGESDENQLEWGVGASQARICRKSS